MDHGTQFTSLSWKASLAAEGVKILFSSIRHPQSNPVERSMQKLGRLFRTYCAQRHTKWAPLVPYVQDCLNLTTHQSTNTTLYELRYGKSPTDKLIELFPRLRDADVLHGVRIQLANEKLRNSFERRCENQKNVSRVIIDVGDLVLLRVPHLSDAS